MVILSPAPEEQGESTELKASPACKPAPADKQETPFHAYLTLTDPKTM